MELEACPGSEVLESGPPLLQKRHFRGHERHFLRHGDALDADFLTDLADREFDRHAGFDADQQKVEGVRKGSFEILASLGDGVAEKHLRRLDAGIGGSDRQTPILTMKGRSQLTMKKV